MKLFIKKSSKALNETGDSLLTERIDKLIVQIQSGWANWLSDQTAVFSKKDWIAILVVFICVTGGYSGYLLYAGFNGGANKMIELSTIRKPSYTGETGEQRIKGIAPDINYSRIVGIRRYLDSLAGDKSGKILYHKIIEKHPGLIDSLRQAENYYKHFKIK